MKVYTKGFKAGEVAELANLLSRVYDVVIQEDCIVYHNKKVKA